MLAVEVLEPVVQGIFFLVALVLFVLAALAPKVRPDSLTVWLLPLGLAFVTFVWMWNAFAAS